MCKYFKKNFFKVFFVIFLIAFAQMAISQDIYNAIYWLDGEIISPSGNSSLTPDIRVVLFYKDDVNSGYAYDISGSYGMSGQSEQFLINTMADWRMPIVAGEKYKVAIVKGSDGYGVNSQEVTISGKGFDTAPTLQLAYGAGVDMPGTKPIPAQSGDYPVPTIDNIKIDNSLYQKKLVAKGYDFIVKKQPKIASDVKSKVLALDTGSISISIDPGT